jgi:hypothetical protein
MLMTEYKLVVTFVLACFTIGNLFFAEFVSYPETAPRPVTLAVEVKKFDSEAPSLYTLDLDNRGSSDSIYTSDEGILLTGWVDPNIDAITIVTSRGPSNQSANFTISTKARPDVAQYFDNAGLEFSGYVISLDRQKYGEVHCVYISIDARARLLYEGDSLLCDAYLAK